MAYLRKEKEIVEVDYPIDKVWTAIQRAVIALDWTIEVNDEPNHNVKAKTKTALMSYSSILSINAVAVADNTTRVNVSAETTVTTLTAIVDFGRTRERIDSFLAELSEQLTPDNGKSEGPE